MPAGIPRPSVIENVSSTLSTSISDVATTISVADASNLVAPCYLVIDRVDSAGTLKSSSLWEYVKVTSIASNDLTVTRGQNGSTAQTHSSGAVIEAVVTSAMFEDWYAVLNPEHDNAGGHVIVGTMTVAGMNLASVATIARMGVGVVNVATHLSVSGASVTGITTSDPLTVGVVNVTTHLNPSGASTSGLKLTAPVVTLKGSFSGPTVNPYGPVVLPRNGSWEWANVMTRTVASGASVVINIKLNGSSIFDTICRPSFAAGGTFVSTASIATKVFKEGNILTVDVDGPAAGQGAHITDIIVQLRST